MPQTIDQFGAAVPPYVDANLFPIGIGTPPNVPTRQGTLLDLAAYMSKKLGTGQLTLVGSANYTMQATDFEVATSTTLTLSPTWTLVPANSVVAGQRRRIVDLAGVIVPGTFQLAVAPGGTDKINGLNAVFWLVARFSHIVLESDGVSNWTIVDLGPSLLPNNNLLDLASAPTARTNLGLGTAATHPITDFLLPSQNLNDVLNKPTARSNLGLGGLAVLSTVAYSNLNPAAIATLNQLLTATTQTLVTSDVLWNSRAPVNIPFNATVTWDFNTFTNGLYGPLTANSAITATNPKPGQSGFIVIRNGSPARTLTWPASGIFNWVNTTIAISATINSVNLLEYWVETTSLIRTRLTINI